MNQGTLVVFNLDPSITNDDLHGIFGAHGEIKEVSHLFYMCITFITRAFCV